jgi:MoxR-like ATPase
MILVNEEIPVLLEGEAGCGKTAIIEYLASKTNTPLFRLNLNSFTTIPDILGKSNIMKN